MRSKTQTVEAYFHRAIDGGEPALIAELFTKDCAIHRPEMDFTGSDKLTALISRVRAIYANFHTEIHAIVEQDDTVVARLTHSATSLGPFISRTGIYDVKGKPIVWSAMAMFRFEGERIAEEWVNRDELGMLLDYGLLQPSDEVAELISTMLAG